MVGLLRYIGVWRARKTNKFSLTYGIISNNLKTGLIAINKSTSSAIGYLKGIKI